MKQHLLLPATLVLLAALIGVDLGLLAPLRARFLENSNRLLQAEKAVQLAASLGDSGAARTFFLQNSTPRATATATLPFSRLRERLRAPLASSRLDLLLLEPAGEVALPGLLCGDYSFGARGDLAGIRLLQKDLDAGRSLTFPRSINLSRQDDGSYELRMEIRSCLFLREDP